MSLLNNPFALIATTSLTIQIIVLFLLLYGYSLKRKLRFRQHGITMSAAVVLHLVVVFAIMIPSFVLAVIPGYVIPNFSGIISVVSLVHAVAGALAGSLGVWLVAS
jgi:membrane-associated HD superfamily phosphohydrolase